MYVIDLYPLQAVVYTRTRLTSNAVHEICDNTKAAVIVLMQTLSTFLTDPRSNIEFLSQFPSKTFLWSFSVLNLASWNSQKPASFSPGDRRASKTQPFFRMIAAATTLSQFILPEDDHNPTWFTSPNQVLTLGHKRNTRSKWLRHGINNLLRF